MKYFPTYYSLIVFMVIYIMIDNYLWWIKYLLMFYGSVMSPVLGWRIPFDSSSMKAAQKQAALYSILSSSLICKQNCS